MALPGSLELIFPDAGGDMARLMRDLRWETTPLGPVEGWPAPLRATVRTLLSSRFSMWMGWGDELTFFYNDAYRRDTLGAKHPWALGRPAREVWREIWPEVAPRLARVLADGQATWDEGLMLVLERSGYAEETYHTFSYSPLHDDDGQIRGVLCVVTEDTARRISERRVGLLGKLAAETAGAKTNEEVLAGLERCLASDARDLPFTLTYLFDPDGGTARLASQTGFATAAPGVAAAIVLDGSSRWKLRDLSESGEPGEIVLDGAWPAGPWATPPVRAFVAPILRQGQARPVGAFITGISPHRAFDTAYRAFVTLLVGQLAAGLANAWAYDAERRRTESFAELDRAKTTFFSNVSHEFRTPLTLMLGPLRDLLVDPDVPAQLHQEISTIHRNGLRLLKLVNTMLDFSRIEAGRATAQFVATDLAQLTSDLASVFRAATDKAGVALIVDCPPLAAAVHVDRDMWEKIVLNLVSNAFKFTLAGEIRVSLAQFDDHIDLVVRDTGSGIPEDELPRVFERFHRVEGSKGRTHEGTGIGLALVQELVRLHGGSIMVSSELGRGTAFTVSLPLVAATAGTAIASQVVEHRSGPNAFVEEALRWLPDPSADVPAVAAGGAARPRVLIADDNADMRDYLRRLLGTRWEVEATADGRAALAAIRRRRPDLVISDVMMPELDGLGVVTAVREDPELRDLPIILLSARAGEDARIEGLRAGATDYLYKPFTSRDLLARVETQLMHAALRSTEQAHARNLQAIFEQAPVAVAVVRGPDHIYELANQPYRQLVGDRPVVGHRVVDVLPDVMAQGFLDLHDRVYRTGEPFVGQSMSILLQRTPGAPADELFFDVVYQPLFDAAGAVTGIASFGHEVTALAVARRDAEVASRAKDEFLAMLGHELRNPLAPIMTALELMRIRPNVGAERERAVIERQVQHLIGLVDDLLDVSRITRGKVELRAEPVDLAEIIARSVEVVSPLLEEHRHVLVVDARPGLIVHGDPGRLAQVVSNLLTNAAKYTPRAGEITVRAWRDAGALIVRVTDNGVGIEPAMLRRIFEPFAQERQSIDRARGGLGLGLAIVDNLIKLHGGNVTASSEGRTRGSAFTVTLPAHDAAAVPGVTEPARDAAATGDARVLIVDDNVDAALLLGDLLEASGFHTVVAHDGPSALAAAETLRPQIAVVDIGLPVMDGYELARLLQARPELGAPRLVALTGYGQAQDRARTAAAGFDAHLVKPVDIAALRRVLESLRPPRS